MDIETGSGRAPVHFDEAPRLSGKGSPVIHFSHANGFHPDSYRKILDPLRSDYRIMTGLHRPLWPSKPPMEEVSSWKVLADDMIGFLESRKVGEIYGIGHSLGAVVTLIAAAKRPDLFKAIILIDPVFMPRRITLLFSALPMFFKRQIPVVRKAIGRPDKWSSREEAFNFHRKKQVFKNIGDDVLWDYILSGTEEIGENTIALRYTKEWEAHCYMTLFNAWPLLKKCPVPIFGIRGEQSDVLLPSVWQQWKKLGSFQLNEVRDAGHLVPFERPEEVSDLIRSFINRHAHAR